MKIGIPTFGADNGKSGIGEYLRAILREWSLNNPEHHFELVGPKEDQAVFAIDADNWSWITISDSWSSPSKNLVWNQTHLPRLARKQKWDVLFLPAGNRRLPWRSPCPKVGTVHDFSHLHVDGKYDRLRHLYVERVLPALVRRLDTALTVSQCSAKDLLSHAKVDPNRLQVIPNGAELSAFQNLDTESAKANLKAELGVDRPFVLYVSRLEHPGKNHVALIEAFEIFRAKTGLDWDLVLPGQDWNGAEIVHQKAEQSSEKSRIKLPGFLSRQTLMDCYAAANLFAFPSLYEGFGIPLLEAMAAGVPVLAANRSSLPEVGGDAAIYFDPDSPADLAENLVRLAGDETQQQRMRLEGFARCKNFSWGKTAAATLRALEQASAGSKKRAA